jgi:hypothetical protein
LDSLRKRHWLPKSQQSNVMIIRVLIEVAVSDDCTDRALNRFCLGCHKLIMISQYHANFASFQPSDTMRRLVMWEWFSFIDGDSLSLFGLTVRT